MPQWELEEVFIYLFIYFAISWAAFVAYGGSQARGPIGAADAGLRQSHSNVGSEPNLDLHHSSQQHRILNPPNKARDRTRNLMVPGRIRFCCAMIGTPDVSTVFYSHFKEALRGEVTLQGPS